MGYTGGLDAEVLGQADLVPGSVGGQTCSLDLHGQAWSLGTGRWSGTEADLQSGSAGGLPGGWVCGCILQSRYAGARLGPQGHPGAMLILELGAVRNSLVLGQAQSLGPWGQPWSLDQWKMGNWGRWGWVCHWGYEVCVHFTLLHPGRQYFSLYCTVVGVIGLILKCPPYPLQCTISYFCAPLRCYNLSAGFYSAHEGIFMHGSLFKLILPWENSKENSYSVNLLKLHLHAN